VVSGRATPEQMTAYREFIVKQAAMESSVARPNFIDGVVVSVTHRPSTPLDQALRVFDDMQAAIEAIFEEGS